MTWTRDPLAWMAAVSTVAFFGFMAWRLAG
jgi:hypothetical protein